MLKIQEFPMAMPLECPIGALLLDPAVSVGVALEVCPPPQIPPLDPALPR